MFLVKNKIKPYSLNLPCILRLNDELSYLKTETTNYFLYKCKQVYCQCIEVLYSHTVTFIYTVDIFSFQMYCSKEMQCCVENFVMR